MSTFLFSPRKRSATAKALPLASMTRQSLSRVWRSAHFSRSGSATRVEVLTTRASQGSLPWRMAPAKLSGCTSSPTIRSALLLLIFLASFLLCCPLLHGRRGRAPDEYLKRRHPGLHRSYALHLHEGSFRQDSLSLQSGIYAPLQRSSPCRYCASVLVLSLFASPISEANRMLRPRLPSSSINFMPKPIPSADCKSFCFLRFWPRRRLSLFSLG